MWNTQISIRHVCALSSSSRGRSSELGVLSSESSGCCFLSLDLLPFDPFTHAPWVKDQKILCFLLCFLLTASIDKRRAARKTLLSLIFCILVSGSFLVRLLSPFEFWSLMTGFDGSQRATGVFRLTFPMRVCKLPPNERLARKNGKRLSLWRNRLFPRFSQK
jgi:hypothetical protein